MRDGTGTNSRLRPDICRGYLRAGMGGDDIDIYGGLVNPLLLGPLLEIGKGLIDRLFPDPAAKAAAQMELLRMQQNGDLAQLAAHSDIAKAQLAVNAAEASSGSVFVAGWRPAVGWICAAALGYQFLGRPLLGYWLGSAPIELDTTDLYSLLFGMLGIGGLRTLEKIKGVSK